MRLMLALAASLLIFGCGRSATRTEETMPQPQHSPEVLALSRITPGEPGATLELSSDAIGTDGVIDPRNTAYGNNLSPRLRWTPVKGAGAYAIVLEDPDAPGEHPFVHWMIWNIPGNATSLAPGVSTRARLDHPKGAVQGRNVKGGFGYYGPRPPSGHGVHRYHFQLFALDKLLPMPPDTPLEELLNALKADTIASAELVGAYEAPATQ